MFFKLIGAFFFIGLVGFGIFTYTQYMDSLYQKKEQSLMEELKMAQTSSAMSEDSKMKLENQLRVKKFLKKIIKLLLKRKWKKCEKCLDQEEVVVDVVVINF